MTEAETDAPAREETNPDPAAGRNPDASRACQIAVVGKKGEGKTELAYLLFDSYPYDRLAIDPNADLKLPEHTLELTPPIPTRWPASQFKDEDDQVAVFKPDFGSPTYREEIDEALGLAYAHRKTCVFVDEAHEAFPASRTLPHARRCLRQGRHHELTLICATPRPLTVDPLVIANADWVYIFKLKNPADRRRIADSIGWDPKAFDRAVDELGPFEYLRYDDKTDDLAHFPPLPIDLIRHHRS